MVNEDYARMLEIGAEVLRSKNYSTETLKKMLATVQGIDKGEWSLDAARIQMGTYKACRDHPRISGFLDAAESNILDAVRHGKDITQIFQELCDLKAERQRN